MQQSEFDICDTNCRLAAQQIPGHRMLERNGLADVTAKQAIVDLSNLWQKLNSAPSMRTH